tara:strand:+ start:254 stop:640 length:387 start_codon:yes stop_codon:yes gene_type:complete
MGIVYQASLGSMYMIMRFNFKNKLNNRRFTSNNVISFSKSSCRVAATPRTLGSLHFPFFHNQGSFNSCNTKAKNKVTKIHLRSFTSRKSCWVFKQILKRRFNKFSNKKLTIRTNIRGTKIQYFCGANR